MDVGRTLAGKLDEILLIKRLTIKRDELKDVHKPTRHSLSGVIWFRVDDSIISALWR